MKRILHILTLGLMTVMPVFMTSCATEDPITETSDANFENPFAIPDDETGPEADIRRAFYKETNVFLVFHDLLRTYTDRFGNTVNETVDIAYELNGNKGYDYEYDELETTEEKQAAAEIIKKYFLPHINSGKLRPFSVLAVKSITQINGTIKSKIGAVNNFRTLALSMADFDGLEDADEIQKVVSSVLKGFIKSKVYYTDSQFTDLMAVNDAHYYEDIVDFIPDWVLDQDITKIYALGMLRYYTDWYGDPAGDYFVLGYTDFEDFFNLLFDYSEAEVRQTYGDYPVIINKYEMLKNAIEGMGYIF